jgi:hypothetical protein
MSGRDYSVTRAQEKARSWILGKLATAQTKKFYGKMVIKMEKGVILQLEIQESHKPPS